MEDLDNFKLYLFRQGKTPETAKNYIFSIKYLLSRINPFTLEQIEHYLTEQIQKGRAPGGLNALIIALRMWGKFIGTEEYSKVKFFPVKEGNKATLSDQEIEAFLALPAPAGKFTSSWVKERYDLLTLFFKVLAYTGMRPKEVATLTIESIDFGRNVFILDKTKTTGRLVPISPALIADLTNHIKNLKSDYLFPGNTLSKPISKDAWCVAFNNRRKKMGIKRANLSTYSLRHSFITRWAGQDINIFKIQRMVGHKRIETTANYMHLVTKDLVAATNKDPLIKKQLSKKELALQVKESLEKEEYTLVEFRELGNGNIRIELKLD